MPSNTKIAKAALSMAVITIASKILGFLRDIVLAAKYGATAQTDAYVMAQSITGVVTGLVIAALGTTFIPVLAPYLHGGDQKRTHKFVNNIYTVSTGITIALCILGIVFAPLLVRLFAPKFSGELFSLTVNLTRLMFPLVVFTVVATLHSSLLQSYGNFAIPAAVGFPSNIALIVTMLLFTDVFGIRGVAVAAVIGGAGGLLLQAPFVKRLGYRFRPEIDLREEGLRKIGILILPVIVGSGLGQINLIVDRSLASGLAEGSIAALNFSSRLNAFASGIFIMAISTVCYPALSAYCSADSMDKFKKLLLNGMNAINLIMVPAAVGFIVLRVPILQVLFERGAFDRRATELTAAALQFFSLGIAAYGLRDLLSRAFYSLQDTKTPMVNGAIAVLINIALNLILVKFLGIGGLALATAAAGIIGAGLLMLSLYRKIGDFGVRDFVLTLCKISFASLVMGAAVYYTHRYLTGVFSGGSFKEKAATLCLDISMGILVYLAAILLLKVEEVRLFVNVLIRRLGKRRLGRSHNL